MIFQTVEKGFIIRISRYPFFCDMDCKVTSELHMQFLCELEDVEVHVMAFTCEQGGAIMVSRQHLE